MPTFTYNNSNSVSDGGGFFDVDVAQTVNVTAAGFVLNFNANGPNLYKSALVFLALGRTSSMYLGLSARALSIPPETASSSAAR